jgi:hypothetical protein
MVLCQYPFHWRETGCAKAELTAIRYCSPFERRRLRLGVICASACVAASELMIDALGQVAGMKRVRMRRVVGMNG